MLKDWNTGKDSGWLRPISGRGQLQRRTAKLWGFMLGAQNLEVKRPRSPCRDNLPPRPNITPGLSSRWRNAVCFATTRSRCFSFFLFASPLNQRSSSQTQWLPRPCGRSIPRPGPRYGASPFLLAPRPPFREPAHRLLWQGPPMNNN